MKFLAHHLVVQTSIQSSLSLYFSTSGSSPARIWKRKGQLQQKSYSDFLTSPKNARLELASKTRQRFQHILLHLNWFALSSRDDCFQHTDVITISKRFKYSVSESRDKQATQPADEILQKVVKTIFLFVFLNSVLYKKRVCFYKGITMGLEGTAHLKDGCNPCKRKASQKYMYRSFII